MKIFTRKKVTKKDLVLELLLKSDHEMYPLEMVAASNGRLKKGTIYNTLTSLELDGYIEARDGNAPPKMGGLPQRFYKISEYGRRVINVHREFEVVRYPSISPDVSLAPA